MPTEVRLLLTNGSNFGRTPSCWYHWHIWVPAGTEPRLTGHKTAILTTESHGYLRRPTSICKSRLIRPWAGTLAQLRKCIDPCLKCTYEQCTNQCGLHGTCPLAGCLQQGLEAVSTRQLDGQCLAVSKNQLDACNLRMTTRYAVPSSDNTNKMVNFSHTFTHTQFSFSLFNDHNMCCPLPNLSLHFNGLFPGEPGLAGVHWSKGWW